MDKLIGAGSFKELVRYLVEKGAQQLLQEGETTTRVYVVKDSKMSVYAIPDGREQMVRVFLDIVEKNKEADGYVFITESWSLSIPKDDTEAVAYYMNDPESIALNPFKEEGLTFTANGYGQQIDGHILFTRGEDGSILLGELEYDEPGEPLDTDVSQLLKPMIGG